ncbi:valyl-tRNA synthetase domain protein, partial [Chlamydia psittaci 06-1683]
PPQLPANAPISEVIHPREIVFCKFWGENLYCITRYKLSQ